METIAGVVVGVVRGDARLLHRERAVPTLQVDLDAWAPTPTDVASAAASSHLVLAALLLVVTIAPALLTCRRADESLPHG